MNFREKALWCAAALLLSSCIEIHASFKMKEDGSGYGKITYVINQGLYSAPEDYKLAINEDKLAETISQKEGVKVIKTGSSYGEGNLIRVWAEFEFKDITKLSDQFSRYTFEDIGNGVKELRITYMVSGQLHQRDILLSLFKGLTSTVEVEVPGRIKSTNGKVISKNKVRWEIPATEVVGRNYIGNLIVSFETKKEKGLLRKILDSIL